MNRLLLVFALLLLAGTGARAQFGSFGDVPIEITSEETRVEGGLAIAEQNVTIRYGTIVISCEYAQYNPETRDVLVQGNVRIYREGRIFTGERALYNLETKVLSAADFRGDFPPFRFAGGSLNTLGDNAYFVKDGLFTTSDSSKPDYVLRAKTVRIYPKDRIVFTNVRLYIGRTPVFWFPYLHQSLNKEQGFTITPGYSSVWGAYLLGQYTFPVGDMSAKLRLDLLSKRGVGVGFESEWGSERGRNPFSELTPTTDTTAKTETEETSGNWGRFRSYYIEDANPGINKTSLAREPIDASRYRVSLQNRTYLTEDIYASIDFTKLSDARLLQDFDEGEFRRNPNPDNMISVTKWNEDYTATIIARKNLNEENFDATERLPDAALDIKRQPLFKTPLFYEGETSAGFYRRNFVSDSLIADYDTLRADSFHQITYPNTYLGWLSFVPRFGVRGTYYANSGRYEDQILEEETNRSDSSIESEPSRIDTSSSRRLREEGSLFRPVVNAGFETSFKFSRAWEQAQSRMWGLDGLRHVVQPWMNASYVYSGEDPVDILQFDRLNRSTQLAPIDFPQFNSIDSIDNWSIVRLGVNNRLQTRRDNRTLNWLELSTYFDVNIDRPDFLGDVLLDDGTFSNVFNRLRWVPLPWVQLNIDSQLPLLDSGFTEVNSQVHFLVNQDLQLNVGHRFISGTPTVNDQQVIQDDNELSFGAYLRLTDNWGFSFREQYEFEAGLLESQRYEVHRDLSSWVASLGLVVRDNNGVSDYGVLLTFTLKDLPNVRLPLSLDPEGTGGGGTGKNR